MWVLSEHLKNTITHPLRVEDVNIEWAVKKQNYVHAKSQKDVSLNTMICQGTYMFVNTDVTNKFKIPFIDLDRLCAVNASINIIFTLQSPVTIPAISR